jgi:hypothetical protein
MSRLLSNIKVLVGVGLTILGGLIYFDMERYIERGYILLGSGAPEALTQLLEVLETFGKVQAYCIVLIIIGIFLTADGLARLRLSR